MFQVSECVEMGMIDEDEATELYNLMVRYGGDPDIENSHGCSARSFFEGTIVIFRENLQKDLTMRQLISQ